MENFELVNVHITDTVSYFRKFFSTINKETVRNGGTLSDEQMERLVVANAQADMATKLKQRLAESDIFTKEHLIEAIREARKLCMIRKNLTHVGILQQAEEAKLHFLNLALYKAQKTEEDEETEHKAFMRGKLETDEEIVNRINEEEDYQQ